MAIESPNNETSLLQPTQSTREQTATPERSNVIPFRIVPSSEPAPSSVTHQVQDIYPIKEALSPALLGVLRLLPEAAEYAEQAFQRAQADDYIGMDDAITHLRSLLPELFACRTIGDGFGMIINSAFWALQPTAEPLSKAQAQVLSFVLGRVRNRPMLSTDDASKLVETLEEAGLNVEPSGVGALATLDETTGE